MCQNNHNNPSEFKLVMPVNGIANQDIKSFSGNLHLHNHDHHDHSHAGHHHHHDHNIDERMISINQNILQYNDVSAAKNRGYFEAKEILSINLMSSPGSGKTSLLEKTLHDLKDEIQFYVIEGDQQTSNDADRINKLNVPVIQINTGSACHLEGNMVYQAVKTLNPVTNSILMIENVGNLVCPAAFDLGETFRVVIISTTEGDDKPIKYPDMFHTSHICIINKIDLLPYLNFNVEKAKEYAKSVNPKLKFFEVSATSGEGMNEWYNWLKAQLN